MLPQGLPLLALLCLKNSKDCALLLGRVLHAVEVAGRAPSSLGDAAVKACLGLGEALCTACSGGQPDDSSGCRACMPGCAGRV